MDADHAAICIFVNKNATEFISFKDGLCSFFVFRAWWGIVDEQFGDPPARKTPGCPEEMEIPLALGHPIGVRLQDHKM